VRCILGFIETALHLGAPGESGGDVDLDTGPPRDEVIVTRSKFH
jgi:hypothetical protein